MLLENNKGRLSHLIVKDTLDENKNLDKNQRSFITRLFQGTIERTIEEDYIINLFSKTKVNKMKPVIRYILRMSVYQLKYMDSVPESAVCNEAVKLAKKRKFSNLSGFVNGVVRNIARNILKKKMKDLRLNIQCLYGLLICGLKDLALKRQKIYLKVCIIKKQQLLE